MTSKELLYVEDALGHAQFYQTKFQEMADKITDPDLKNCAWELGQKHKKMYDEIYNLL